MQPKKGKLSLRPFAAREMNMSSGKKGCCRLDPFFLGCWIIIDLPSCISLAKETNMPSSKRSFYF